MSIYGRSAKSCHHKAPWFRFWINTLAIGQMGAIFANNWSQKQYLLENLVGPTMGLRRFPLAFLILGSYTASSETPVQMDMILGACWPVFSASSRKWLAQVTMLFPWGLYSEIRQLSPRPGRNNDSLGTVRFCACILNRRLPCPSLLLSWWKFCSVYIPSISSIFQCLPPKCSLQAFPSWNFRKFPLRVQGLTGGPFYSQVSQAHTL